MGAPRGNTNAVKHGLGLDANLALERLSLKKLPAGLKRVEDETHEFRRLVEAATLAARGEIGLYESALINTAALWERHARCCSYWLRENKALNADQKLVYSREIARAAGERDRRLKDLGLDKSPSNGAIDINALLGPADDLPDIDPPHNPTTPTSTPSAKPTGQPATSESGSDSGLEAGDS